VRTIGIVAGVVVAALVGTLAIPVNTWRTGDQELSPLVFEPSEDVLPRKLWIDTDAACGHGARTDPDDCLALVLLAGAPQLDIAGISTVAGNASPEVVERTTRELVGQLPRAPAVYSGQPARQALMAALEQGPLAFVALGPLTNLAALLAERPDLQPRLARVVAVMGRRPGHIFHPAEGHAGAAFLGHGPIFRDFNFEMDRRAAAQVVAQKLPLVLVPYDAARRVEIGAADLDRLDAAGGAPAWVAQRARGWLAYWREDIGRDGFSPFDLLAAAYVVEPRHFGCARVDIRVREDPTLFIPFWRPTALLVTQDKAGSGLYCAHVTEATKPWLMSRLSNRPFSL
jgi:purine nucleosidase